MPQRRQNSMVRTPMRSIFGCSIRPSVFSINVQETPRQPRSPASARPTGPAPTIRTGVRALIGRHFRQLVAFAIILECSLRTVETDLDAGLLHLAPIHQAEPRWFVKKRDAEHRPQVGAKQLNLRSPVPNEQGSLANSRARVVATAMSDIRSMAAGSGRA